MDEKKQLKINVSPSCIGDIWEHAISKNGRYRKGLLSEETEFLINLGLSTYKRQKLQYEHTHTNTSLSENAKVIPKPILLLKGAIINHILDKYGDFQGTLSEEQLRESIRCITKKSKDKRTQNSHIDSLIDYRLVACGKDRYSHKVYTFGDTESAPSKEEISPAEQKRLDTILKPEIMEGMR
jgi:hypothetical protein